MTERRHFSKDEMDTVRANNGLVDVIGRRVALKKQGHEHKGLCPFHDEKTPSFAVNEAKGFYHCFGCGAHGDVIGFVMRTESIDIAEAIARLLGDGTTANKSVPTPVVWP